MTLPRGLFVTGTDTEIGKTRICQGLITACQDRGHRTLGMKPVASGCARTEAGLRNEDARALLRAGSLPQAYETVNPYAFEPAVSPHIAAEQEGIIIELARIGAAYRELAAAAEMVVVEGVGGWYAPLGPALTVADLARYLDLPVILVVGLRLGALNHALLTARAIGASGLPLAGWVANRIDPTMAASAENLAYLHEHIPAPLLGVVPHLPQATVAQTASHLDLDVLT